MTIMVVCTFTGGYVVGWYARWYKTQRQLRHEEARDASAWLHERRMR